MSQIQDYYLHTVHKHWMLNYPELERTHNFIQLMFPLQEKSQYHPEMPTLTQADITFFGMTAIRQRLYISSVVMLGFYGFEYYKGAIHRAGNFDARAGEWCTPKNHNFLRITRMLKSMTLLGLEYEAMMFFSTLSLIYSGFGKTTIGNETYHYWMEAIQR
jgi:hypothetical protein